MKFRRNDERLLGENNPAKRLDVRMKISKALKGRKFSETHLKNLSLSQKGHKHSEETKKKMSEIHKRIGTKPPNRTGIKCIFTEKHKQNISKNHHNVLSEKNPNWRGGITPENLKIRLGVEYRLWREVIFARDDYTCQKCGQGGGQLHPHHIFNFATYLDLRFAINNGITLCKKCHMEFHKKHGYKNNTKEQLEKFLTKN
jgi:hypothetical protein